MTYWEASVLMQKLIIARVENRLGCGCGQYVPEGEYL